MTTLLLAIGLVLLSLNGSAQDRIIEERDGQQFFVHKVEAGHTLYSLSKLYDVSIEEIEKHNTGAMQGLQLGQTLYIPVPGSYNSDSWTNPIRIENGFMIHRVMKKETLYGISKQYEVDINDLLAENPGIELGLDVGEELKIPQSIPVESVAIEESEQGRVHVVEQGETLYSLSKFYGYRVDELIDLNPGIENGLSIGQTIKLPEEQAEFTAVQEEVEMFEVTMKDTMLVKDAYSVKILLPFNLGVEEPSTKVQRLREISMSFYRGAVMALDSLEKRGARLEVEVLDAATEAQIDDLIDNGSLKGADIIIGPLQKSGIAKVAKYSSTRGIHVVCPTLSKNSILLTSPNLSKVKSSEASHMKALAQYVAKNHKGENIILINSKELTDARKIQLFKKYYNESMSSELDSGMFSIQEIEASSKFVGKLEEKMSLSRRNIIVVPAGKNSRSMIANLQTKLQMMDLEKFQTVLYGTEDWFDFDFLDASFKNEVKLRLPSSGYVDYQEEENVVFVRAFQQKYATDPTDFGFLGYDIMTYYGQGLMQFGLNFPNRFNFIDQTNLLYLHPAFYKTGFESGYENEGSDILTHEDFEITVLEN
ncbi:MAG: LysM peptidoglycan-binding domain-containing protein [Bacteroidota bacterium]